MKNQLEKALALAKKTGDRLIVFESPESEKAFVVMNLEQYEDLVEGDCCGGSCHCDDHESELEEELDFPPDFLDNDDYKDEVASLTEEEMLDKINRDIALWKEVHGEENDSEDSREEAEESAEALETESKKQRSRWAIRNDVKEAAEEIIEEDRHYLEEVNF